MEITLTHMKTGENPPKQMKAKYIQINCIRLKISR